MENDMGVIDLSMELAIGIDIGGTNTKYGIVNHRGEILDKGDIKTDAFPTIEEFINGLHEAVSPIIEKYASVGIKGIGLGAPNGNYYTGTIEYAPNLPWRGVIPIAKMITERFSVPCTLTNDANAAAMGEMLYGAARGMKDFIMITLGTGVRNNFV